MQTPIRQPLSYPPTTLAIPAVVCTDLDATLLDNRYDLEAAAQCLDHWSAKAVVVIPASSKTLVEMVALNRLRRYPSPLIYENGAGVAWPGSSSQADAQELGGYHRTQLNQSYETLCTLLQRWQAEQGLRSRGFHQMSAKEVAAATGLSIDAAGLAKQREASEPILWHDSDALLALCAQQAQDHNLQLIRGGRFVHLMSKADKGQAFLELAASYGNASSDHKPLLLGFGDSANDAALLAVCDACAVFPRARGAYLPVFDKPLVRAPGPGPKHWHNALNALIGDTTP